MRVTTGEEAAEAEQRHRASIIRNSASVDRDARCDVPVGGRGIDALSLQSRP